MLLLIGFTGVYFSFRLHFFQIFHHSDMWHRIFEGNSTRAGISTFASFCSTMAMRIGTGNVAGVALAIYRGGPGSMLWMWLIGITNSAVCFVECTLSQLYKTKIDGEYRGSASYCAQRGMNAKKFGIVIAVIFGLGAALFMPAAASYTISESFRNSFGISLSSVSFATSCIFAVIVIGGIKRIGTFASYVVPFMTLIYLALTIYILVVYIHNLPHVISMIFKSAFGRDAMIYGSMGAAIQQGIQRGTFSSASGMGESMPAAAAAESSHPVMQGLANSAGVFMDMIVCSCTGFIILMTDCFNTMN